MHSVIELFGALCVGHSDSHSRNVPTLVKDISGVGQAACGSSHTIAVAQDGRIVWSFGGGDNGTHHPHYPTFRLVLQCGQCHVSDPF